MSEIAFLNILIYKMTPFEEMVTDYYGADRFKLGKSDDITGIKQFKH